MEDPLWFFRRRIKMTRFRMLNNPMVVIELSTETMETGS